MPIYVERISRQTIVYSAAGGTKIFSKKTIIPLQFFVVYILPPLVNAYGKVFSVAELVAYGYATFLSNGAPMSPYFNIAYYANSGPCSYSLC
jgi:hypothetical protein